jgi:excisionase family DNA binding protein
MVLDELPLLLTVEEAARLMRVSRNGAYNAVAEGRVPSIRIGRTIRIPRDALAAALGLEAPRGGSDQIRPDDRDK